jgi:hypothetical protein
MRWQRHRNSGSQGWRADLGRKDLWSGEGSHFRRWLTSSSKAARRRRTVLSAIVWGSIFAALVIGYAYYNNPNGFSRIVWQLAPQ